MTRLAVVSAAALVPVVVVIGIWAMMQTRAADRARDDAQALADLPQRAIAPMIALPTGAADLVVFQDGDAGWFELDVAALPPETTIGFHGPCLLDVFTGNEHLPIYCFGDSTRAGKIIWVVRDGHIARDFAFCNPRRMELSALRLGAHLVEMIAAQVTRADFDAMAPEIAADPMRALVMHPEDRDWARHSHRVMITPPLMWLTDTAGQTRWQLEDRIEAQVRRVMGDVDIHFRQRDGVPRNPTFEVATADQGAAARQVTGMGIVTDDDAGLLPEVQGFAPTIVIDCPPEACDRVSEVALAPVIAPARDMDALRDAMRRMVSDPAGPDRGAQVGWPSLAALESDTTVATEAEPITYLIRTIRRLPPDLSR